MTWMVLLMGCELLDTPPTPNCPDRTLYWPDEDGNGLGEPDRTYVGCSPPEGWVDVLDPALTDTAADTGE